MNLVFLDIDGVLNNLGSAIAIGSTSRCFDPVSVALMAKLCANGDADIVISSSWRHGDTERLKNELGNCGAASLLPSIIGETPYIQDNIRGAEIAAWLVAYDMPLGKYVIIDDDDDMLPTQPFVQTNFQDGFRYRHYVKALQILNPEHQDAKRGDIILAGESG